LSSILSSPKIEKNKNKKVANSDFFLFKATTQCKRFRSTPDLEKCKRFHESVFKLVGLGLGPEQEKRLQNVSAFKQGQKGKARSKKSAYKM
jgi:hypothetical protein